MWVELIAVEDTTAETVVRALFDNVVARYGVPIGLSVLSDNGSAFIAQLTKLFCQTFGIRQHFTTPYHAQSNSRAEEIADTIHASLRAICDKQADWAKHLQAIAMVYRATPTSNISLSPHEVVFGTQMRLDFDPTAPELDLSLSSAQQYAREIRPKLEIIRSLAMQNVEDSANRHKKQRDLIATIPTYQVGDKVLLLDTTVKKGETIKLKQKYTGPFIITHCQPGFNYKLQHAETGKDLRRAVHADRLRPLRQLSNDYRFQQAASHTNAQKFANGRVTWKVSTRSSISVDVPLVIMGIDENWQLLGQIPDSTLLEAWRRCKNTQDCTAPPSWNIVYSSTYIRKTCVPFLQSSINTAFFIRLPEQSAPAIDASSRLQQAYRACFRAAARQQFTSFACLSILTTDQVQLDAWHIAQALAEALRQAPAELSADQHQTIEILCNSVLEADIFTTVFKQILRDDSIISQTAETSTPNDGANRPSQIEAVPTNNIPTADTHLPSKAQEWYEIDCVLKRRKQAGGDRFLVKWKDSGEQSWVKRQDLSPAAIQHFYAQHHQRRKRRRT